MKTMIRKPWASVMLLVATIALAAMVLAPPAQAATLTHNFTDAAGANFSIKNAYSVEKVTSAVTVVAQDGSTATYSDPTGALHVKLVNYMASTGSWYRIPGTQLDLNVTEAKKIACNASTGDSSYFLFPNNYLKFYYDSCAAKNAVVTQSN